MGESTVTRPLITASSKMKFFCMMLLTNLIRSRSSMLSNCIWTMPPGPAGGVLMDAGGPEGMGWAGLDGGCGVTSGLAGSGGGTDGLGVT